MDRGMFTAKEQLVNFVKPFSAARATGVFINCNCRGETGIDRRCVSSCGKMTYVSDTNYE